MKKTGLGRGLDALIDTSHVDTNGGSSISEIELSAIVANPDQPRRSFDEEALQELADSIREHGVISPITLRDNGDGTYMIIAGERRFRASKMAGLERIPAYIRTAKDEQVMEWALIENIQREDLDAIEIALAYEHLAETTGMTQEKISERVGKSRTAVTNYMRLLKLPAQIQMSLKNHEIDMGHARALLSIDSPSMQLKLFREVQKNQYSVRKVEDMVRMIKDGEDMHAANKKVASKTQLPPEFNTLKKRLSDLFQTKVQMTCSAQGKGKISIPFADEEELERIMNALDRLRN
jgi:ParB family chromosome partitioning protein